VTAALAAVSVAFRLALDPTLTLPKSSDAGETLSFAGALLPPVPVPVPEVEMLRVGLSVLLVSVKVPSVYPVAVGLKTIGNSTLTQDGSVMGKGKLPDENALPFCDTERIVKAALPVFVSWIE
jgi:hypothetical protein